MSSLRLIPAITVIFLLLMCLTHISSAQSNKKKKTLLVAVEDGEIFNYLLNRTATTERMHAAFPYVDKTGVSLSLVHMPIRDSLDTVSKTDIVLANLTQLDVSAVVSDYYISLAIATYTLGIPYFVIRKNVFSFPPPEIPNIFEIEIDNFHMGQALYDIAMVYKRTILVVISDGTPQSSQFLVNFAGRIFSTFLVNNSNTDDDIYSGIFSMFQSNSLPSGMGWILLFDEPNLPLMERTLAQAARAGMFVINQVFFIPTLFDKQNYLTRFYRSNVEFLTFVLVDGGYYSQSELLQPFVLDCLNHYLKAYKAWPTLASNVTISMAITATPSIENPHTGLYIYHPMNRVRAKVQINVMHTNESKSSNSSIYSLAGIWQNDGTGTPPYKPNYAVADDIAESRIIFVAFESAPYFYGYDSKTGTGRGLALEMIEVLRLKLGFEYKVDVVADRNAALQKLKKGEADVSLNFLTPTDERLNYTDSSIEMVQDGVQMLVKKVIRSTDFRHLFHPFSLYVWFSIGITIILMTTTLFACNKISPNHSESQQLFTMLECLFLVLSSFLLAKSNAQPKKVSSRLFILLLRFSTLMYVMTYLSNQVAMLIQSDEQISVSSVSELQTLVGYKWGFVRNSLVDSQVQENWPKVYSMAQQGWPSDMYFDSLNDALDRVLSDPFYILIDSADILSYVKTTDCNFIVMGNMGNSHQLTWLFRKKFAFGDELSKQLAVEKTGVFIQMRSKYFELNRCYSGRTDIANKLQLGFDYLYGLFVLLGVGLFLGFFNLFCQWVFQRVQEWQNAKKQVFNFRLGHVYTAEVIDAKKTGIWICIEDDNEVRFVDNSCLNQENDEDAFRCNTQLKGHTIQVQYVGVCGISGGRVFKRLSGIGADLFTMDVRDGEASDLNREESCSV